MSKMHKNTVYGKLDYRHKIYGVLNAPLSDEIVEKLENLEKYHCEKKWVDSAAPWKTTQLVWVMEGEKLYLEKLYTDGLLEELTGSKRVLATWVSELKLLVDEKTICKTYEQKNSYLKEQITLYLHFDKGVLLTEERQETLYTDIGINDEIVRSPSYTTFSISSNDLLIYLEDEGMQPGEDQLLPIFSTFIDQMLEKDDAGISLDISNLKEVLKQGDVALFAFANGKEKNIEKIVSSLISSVTNENILNVKGCLLYLMVNKRYPRKSILNVIEDIDVALKFNYEPLEADKNEPFYVGTRFANGMDEDEISIMILVSI
jgi:hypothetical protein